MALDMQHLLKPFLGAMTCIAILAASNATAHADVPKRGGTLIIAQDQGPDRIDPHGPSMALQHNMIVNGPYEALLTFDESFKIGPSLAVEWKQESPTSYVFTLREGVKFHDGSDMTMDDVLFTLGRITDPTRPSQARNSMRMIKSFAAIDARNLRIELKWPSAAFLRYIAAPEVTGIVSKKFSLANNNDLSTVANGTGPFRITSFQAGVAIKYERHAQYWDSRLPYINAIELRIIPDDSTRIAALRTGEIDMTFFRPDKMPLIRTLKNVTVAPPIQNSVEPFALNCKVPPLDKLEVRQALMLSFDKQMLMNTVVPGLAKPGLIIPSADKTYGYTGNGTDIPNWKRDVAKAKQLLAQAGQANGVTLKIMYINTPAFAINNRIAEFIKQQAAEAGFNMVLEPVEYATLLSSLAQGKYQTMTSGRGVYPDPEGSLFDLISSNPRTACPDKKMDELIGKADQEVDEAKRAALLIEVQKYAAENAYSYPLFNSPIRIEVWRPELIGYKPLPLLRRTSLREAWLNR